MIDLKSIGKTVVDVAEIITELIKETILEDENNGERKENHSTNR